MTKHLLIATLAVMLFPLNSAWAESDKEIQEKALKARERSHGDAMDHSAHTDPQAGVYRGVFYGYLPCEEADCSGIKMTLSLNAKSNYLLVIQPAKPKNRESYEKGKFEWDEKQGLVTLTPNKDAPQRRLRIQDEGSLLYLSSEGAPLPGDQDKYLLQRSDRTGTREMHIH